MKRKKNDCYPEKTATRRKPQRNTLYLPSASREELDKIALEIGYRRGGVFQALVLSSTSLKNIPARLLRS
jgi:hypothetical protein